MKIKYIEEHNIYPYIITMTSPMTDLFIFPHQFPTLIQLQNMTEEEFLEYGSTLQKVGHSEGELITVELLEEWHLYCGAWYNEAARRGLDLST